MIYIGVDFGGTSIKIGLVKSDKVLKSTQIKAEADNLFQTTLKRLESAIDLLLKKSAIPTQDLGGIGLAFPSLVDGDNMRILSRYVKFTDADTIDLQKWARQTWGIPLAIENDARAALVGEWQYGAAKGVKNAVMLTLGTGVGSAVLIDGKLFKGAHYVGGNLGGHMIINFLGDKCNCGNTGCVETEGSTWVLDDKWKPDPGFNKSTLSRFPHLDLKEIFIESEAGDEFAGKIKNHCLEAWAAATLNMVHAFDPEVVVIGGAVMKSKDKILPFIQSRIDERTWPAPGTYKIIPAEQTEYAGILGMSYLAATVVSGVSNNGREE